MDLNQSPLGAAICFHRLITVRGAGTLNKNDLPRRARCVSSIVKEARS